jgi:predicted SprT family Zn-dependent metalloprotease
MKNKEEVVVVKKMEVPLTLLMKLGSAAVHCEELLDTKEILKWRRLRSLRGSTSMRTRITNPDILKRKRIQAFKDSYYTRIRDAGGRILRLSSEARLAWRRVANVKQRPAFLRRAQEFINLIKRDSYAAPAEFMCKTIGSDGTITRTRGGIVSTPEVILTNDLPGKYGEYTAGWNTKHSIAILDRDINEMKQTLRHEVLHYIDNMSHTPNDHHGCYWQMRLDRLSKVLKLK